MRVLNLYACLGGNRFLWDNCQVTAVEIDEELAGLYKVDYEAGLSIFNAAKGIFENNKTNQQTLF